LKDDQLIFARRSSEVAAEAELNVERGVAREQQPLVVLVQPDKMSEILILKSYK
jgi:hypothetical protein